jgi:hypothetical protein
LLFVTQFANEGRAITTHIPFRTRIDIVLSYARERIDYPELIAELEKLLREIDRKRGERNAYIHAEWSYYPGAPHMMADTFAAHGELKFRTRNVTPADVEKVADDVIALNDKLNELSREVFNAVLNT